MSSPTRLHQYQEIARQLRQQILHGEFAKGGRLPSERALGRQFQVQRNTVRQALSLLESEGHIWTDAKRGSFIHSKEPDTSRNVILVHLHNDASSVFSHMVEGIKRVSDRSGYTVQRVSNDAPKGHVLEPVPEAEKLSKDTAGIILWPQSPTDVEKLMRLNMEIPLVLVDRRVLGLSADCVHCDDVSGGKMVTEHLIEQGHRRIAFLTDEVFAETVQNRWRGYVSALEEANIEVDPRFTLLFQGLTEPLFASTIDQVLSWGNSSPTAIVCSNDLVAFTLLRVLRDRGVRVPDDVAVTGYGNYMPEYLDAMALTSVEQSFEEVGQRAVGILLERMGQPAEERLRNPRDVSIPVRLVARSSSAAIIKAS